MQSVRGSGRRQEGQGMNWVRLSTRLAIYHRDSWACVYCGAAGEEYGVGLTLDHVAACEVGGSNAPTNLVTCCIRHNSQKQAVRMGTFLRRLAEEGIDVAAVARRIRALTRRKLNREEGRRLERARRTRQQRGR